MSATRYVVLGLAHPRSPWFADVGRWASAALLPVEFVRCVSADEIAAHVSSGRRFSAALVDVAARGLDRDLVGALATAGCPTLLVGERSAERAASLGAAGSLGGALEPPTLLGALEQWCQPVGVVAPLTSVRGDRGSIDEPTGAVVAVTGPPGSGSSIVAMALAQGIAAIPSPAGSARSVVLADWSLDALQGLLHAAPDVVPGVSELVDAHRGGVLDPDGVRRLTFADDRRGYRLLLGLRRHRDWVALRPRAVAASLEALRRAFDVVVVDADADVEGEAECGSSDVEERNTLARSAVLRAALVVVAVRPDLLGLHRHARAVHALLGAGVDARRLQPLVIDGPGSTAARAALTRVLADLVTPVHPEASAVAAPIHLPPIRRFDDIVRDARPLPAKVCRRPAESVLARLGTVPALTVDAPGPVAVTPGSLGSWFDDDLEAAGT